MAIAAVSAACSTGDTSQSDPSDEPVAEAASAVSLSTPVRLALEVDGGAGVPLQLRAGQTFYINQIDLRVAIPASVDEGVSGLASTGDFAGLSWGNPKVDAEDVEPLPNNDGTFTRRRYYRGSPWMKQKSTFRMEQVDSAGHGLGPAIVLNVGSDTERKDTDSFYVRRLRALQWTNDCPAPNSCAGATNFQEEALLEIRDAAANYTPFTLKPNAAGFRLSWSARPGAGWIIPVTQVASPQYDYGFSIDLDVLTPPGSNGAYAPGSAINVQATLRDGAGNRLHPQGTLPPYIEAAMGQNPAGIQYYRGFFDPGITYYRRKHRERNMTAALSGPVQDLHAPHSVVPMSEFFAPTAQFATVQTEGYVNQGTLFPPGYMLFGGAFDPEHTAWTQPFSDTWTFQLPADAKPGTYLISMKARRVYLGEDIPATRVIQIQVGTPTPTTAEARVGGCTACHTAQAGGSFSSVLHGDTNFGSCTGCHAPLQFELDNAVYTRVHFVHARSGGRFDQPLDKCSTCHLKQDSIQRTSKAGCMACHSSYPQSHVNQFGPLDSSFVGGGANAFAQCSTTCHTDHPGSGFSSGKGCDH